MKKIVIVRGDEFKVYDNEISNQEDIFEELYERAVLQKVQLEQYGERMEKEQAKERQDRPSEYLNNIIAFCGERGQGKSTAMHHFVDRLTREEKPACEKEILPVIDPTAMEMAHEIVDIIISRLFERFRENRAKNEGWDMELSRAFQKVHRDMSVLKNASSFIEKEYAYNGSLQNLIDITESMGMREDIIRLIDLYLKHREKKMLVIPIDDLDLNLGSVYQVAEQLRKYFMIPRVMIVMAVNIDQLTLCVERELFKNLNPLRESRRWNIRQEARNMSVRYMEKLIPFSRRLQLPDIRAIAEDGENAVEIIYRDTRGRLLFDSEKLGIEKGILNLIFRKTGLVYVARANEVHPIIPDTLRELVNLITLLGDMGEDQSENLDTFEQYFRHVWMENKLSDENRELLWEIAGTQLNDLHNDAFLLLYEIQKEKRASFEKNMVSVLSGRLYQSVNAAYKEMLAGRRRPGNGDLMNCLRLLRQGSRSDISRLVMAVMTVFSIRMLQLKADGKWEVLYNFIGENLFGEYQLIRSGTVRGTTIQDLKNSERMQFEYPLQEFLQSACGASITSWSVSGIKGTVPENILVPALIFMGSFSDFRTAGMESRELVSNNNQIATRAVFDLDRLFLSSVSWERVKEKLRVEKWGIDEADLKAAYDDIYRSDLWKGLVCNMEQLMYLGQYLQDNRGINERAEEADYYVHFFDGIGQFLQRQNAYLPAQDMPEMKQLEAWSKIIAEMKAAIKKENEKEETTVHVPIQFEVDWPQKVMKRTTSDIINERLHHFIEGGDTEEETEKEKDEKKEEDKEEKQVLIPADMRNQYAAEILKEPKDADGLVKCRRDTRFTALRIRVEQMNTYVKKQQEEHAYENYNELMDKIDTLYSETLQHNDMYQIGKEYARQYNELLRAVLREEP